MEHLRRLLAFSALLTPLAAQPAAAQVGVGGHVVHAADSFGGTTGVGARIRLGVPLFPLFAAVNGEYFFPSCDDDCSLWGATFDVNYTFPIPLIQPWAGVGWSVRGFEVNDEDDTERGINIGAGVQLNLAPMKPYLDIRYEMADAPEKQFLIRLGVMFM